MATGNKNTKFTVIIPTRERGQVLYWSLQTVVQQNYKNLEIIVSDNFSSDETRNIVDHFDDPRIKYINPGKRLGMTQNWEFALNHATGEWVTFLGDDDGLLPNALFDINRLILETKTSAIQSTDCMYKWPSFGNNGKWRLKVQPTKGFEVRNCEEWMRKILRLEGATHDDIPVVYRGGFVKLSVLKRIKKITGKYLNSMTPDVYSGFAIMSVLETYVYSFDQFTVSGRSKYSTGGSTFLPEGNATPDKLFQSENQTRIHSDMEVEGVNISPFMCPAILQAFVYESYLQTKILRASSPDEDNQFQLELFQNEIKNNSRNDVHEWVVGFARKHDLNLDIARQRTISQ